MEPQTDGSCRLRQTGGARAVEHLRTISIELQMVPGRSGVHIGDSEFFRKRRLIWTSTLGGQLVAPSRDA
jgi:hypothetical protein